MWSNVSVSRTQAEVLQFHSARIRASHLSRASLEKGLLVAHFGKSFLISRLDST